MTKLALFLIGITTPRVDREAVVGDTIERLEEIRTSAGSTAARRWLWRETLRVLSDAPRHHLAARGQHSSTPTTKDALMSSLWQDVRYALRWFRRAPGFTAVAVVTLALGIGANTAMFAVVNAVLLKPLPFQDADRLMLVHLLSPRRTGGFSEIVWSYPKYRTFVDLQQTFEDSALFSARPATLSGDRDPERVQSEIVTDRYLAVLGVAPILGRGFTFDEANRKGSAPVAIVGYGLWTRRFGRDPAVVGRSIQVGGTAHTVVGVLPPEFRGLSGNADLWVPLAVTDAWALSEPMGHEYMLAALRKPEVAEVTVASAVRVYGGQIDAAYRDGPGTGTPWSARATSLYSSRVDSDLRRVALVVLGAVGFVLLIACVNLANLLVAKALARQREVAVRVALGASRGRVARQFGVEGLTLAFFGSIGGLVIASALLSIASVVLPDADVFFQTSVAPGTPRIAGAAGLTRVGAGMIGLDSITLLFTAGVTILTAVLVSILPAFQASMLEPVRSLKMSPGSSSAHGRATFRPRAVLVAIEIALALILLTGSGLMLRSAWHLRGTSLGINADRVVTAGLELPGASYNAARGGAFYADLVSRLERTAGIDIVGIGSCVPVSGGCNSTSIKFPSNPQTGNSPSVGIRWATPGYFESLGIRVVAGRNFNERDRVGQPKVALVNEAAARAFWPDGSPLGQIIAVGQGGFESGAEVVGVVADVRYRAIETAATPDVFVPLAQSYRGSLRLFVRSALDTPTVVRAIDREVHALDANLPLISVKTMDAAVGDAMWRTRVAAWLLSAFAGLALLLTALGIFGVMAQTVAQRTPEFGLRMALGAQPRDVLTLVLRGALLVTVAGLAVGLVSAFALTRVLSALLYDITPSDPVTLVSVTIVLGIVSLAACYIPALRATKVDAIVALKSD